MSSLHAYTARDLARALGGDVVNGTSVSAPGPGHSRTDRSLSITLKADAPDGFLVFSHSTDDHLACRDYIRERLGVPEWRPQEKGVGNGDPLRRMQDRVQRMEAARGGEQEPVDQDRQRRVDMALRVWGECLSPVNTLVETYLIGRGLYLPDIVVRGDHLRFHPSCAFKLADGTTARLPTMVCLLTDVATREPRAIHRTALAPDGADKAIHPGLDNAKKMQGPSKGCVIRLCPDDEVTSALGLTEGVENAIAVMCSGWTPVWAAGSAGLVTDFPVLPGVEALTILADTGRAGEEAADSCGNRWHAAGHTVEAVFPKHGDWNDALRGDAR